MARNGNEDRQTERDPGFWHVTDFKAAMWNGGGYKRLSFNAQEEYHARLAYEVGRGQRYAGWPFSGAFGPTAVGADRPSTPLPVIVVDD